MYVTWEHIRACSQLKAPQQIMKHDICRKVIGNALSYIQRLINTYVYFASQYNLFEKNSIN